jgi:hypothetical protein
MTPYEKSVLQELAQWKRRMQKRPGLLSHITSGIQHRINNIIPEKIHEAITTAFKGLTGGVLAGSGFTTAPPLRGASLAVREEQVRARIDFYKTASAAEGAATGAGGFLLGLADFPLWLTLKMKMLFNIASLYGHHTSDRSERLYLLYIFQLAFSGKDHRRQVFAQIQNWDQQSTEPSGHKEPDWRRFQQEYRDYIDIPKLLQLVPGIGAAVGAVVNHRLTEKLGTTAMNAYRLRWFASQPPQLPGAGELKTGR